MSDRVFVDTNVLIYAHDADAGRKKRSTAHRVLKELWQSRRGCLNTQVVQEFYVNVTRKIPAPLPRSTARDIVGRYAVWNVVQIDPLCVCRASEIEERHQLSFWDALILTAAQQAGAELLLSEDLNHGQRVGGVLIQNPFLAPA